MFQYPSLIPCIFTCRTTHTWGREGRRSRRRGRRDRNWEAWTRPEERGGAGEATTGESEGEVPWTTEEKWAWRRPEAMLVLNRKPSSTAFRFHTVYWRIGSCIDELATGLTIYHSAILLDPEIHASQAYAPLLSLYQAMARWFIQFLASFNFDSCTTGRRSSTSSMGTCLIGDCLTVTLVPSDSLWLHIQLRRPVDFSYSISALSASDPSWPVDPSWPS